MALRFLVLTATRTSEVLGARWSEIDLDHATWTIPTARMKSGEAHRVPLAEAAVAVLAKARARWGSRAIPLSGKGVTGACSAAHFGEHFVSEQAGPRGAAVDPVAGKPAPVAGTRSRQKNGPGWGSTGLVFRSARGTQMDEAALRRLLRGTVTEATVHGFRGTFKSWCMEIGVSRDLAELSLAHTYMGDAEANRPAVDNRSTRSAARSLPGTRTRSSHPALPPRRGTDTARESGCVRRRAGRPPRRPRRGPSAVECRRRARPHPIPPSRETPAACGPPASFSPPPESGQGPTCPSTCGYPGTTGRTARARGRPRSAWPVPASHQAIDPDPRTCRAAAAG